MKGAAAVGLIAGVVLLAGVSACQPAPFTDDELARWRWAQDELFESALWGSMQILEAAREHRENPCRFREEVASIDTFLEAEERHYRQFTPPAHPSTQIEAYQDSLRYWTIVHDAGFDYLLRERLFGRLHLDLGDVRWGRVLTNVHLLDDGGPQSLGDPTPALYDELQGVRVMLVQSGFWRSMSSGPEERAQWIARNRENGNANTAWAWCYFTPTLPEMNYIIGW
ncbi:MAG: hypothetical protein OXG38_09745 [Chloroflexi bacterium]|nr:hypothetical protein [Chloroflexota bacterium]